MRSHSLEIVREQRSRLTHAVAQNSPSVLRASLPVRLSAAATGVLLGVGLGVQVSGGDVGTVIATAVVAAALAPLLRLVPNAMRRRLAVILAPAFALRVAAAATLHAGSLAVGRGGFIVGDDANYATLSWAFVQYLRGEPQLPYVPPKWHGEDYLFGTYVYLESAVFAIFGPNVVAAEVVNAGLAVASVILLYDLVRRVFGARPALVSAAVIAFYPSIILWSALNLKDALALFLITLTLWTTQRYQIAARWWLLAAAFAVLPPMESLRRYTFTGLAIIVPIAVVLMPRQTWLNRLRWTAIASVIGAFLIVGSAVWNERFGARASTGLVGLERLEQTRYSMAIGARTSFQGPLVVTVPEPPDGTGAHDLGREGATFVVLDACDSTAHERRAPAVVHVAPWTRLVLVWTFQAEPQTAPQRVAYVRAGDIVVIGDEAMVPAPEGRREFLLLNCRAPAGALLVPATSGEALVLTRTLAYLPTGLTYALFAPFPWSLGRALDALTVPEMIFWYAVLAIMPFSLWRHRRRWRLFAPLLLFALGIFAVLTLVEGNVGTLYRHRSMAIPFMIALASPGLALLVDRLGGLARRLVPKAPARPAGPNARQST